MQWPNLHKDLKVVTWDHKKITEFWNCVSQSPMEELSFSKLSKDLLLSFIASNVPPGCSLLDFGSGGGVLAAALLDAGYVVGAVEPSEERQKAFKESPQAAMPNFSGFFSLEDSPQFDAVLAFEVLEHILEDDLAATLNRLRKIVKPSGKLLGSVPHREDLELGSCICPECKSIFHRWQHMRSFHEPSLALLLKTYGFASVGIGFSGKTQSMFFIAS